MSHGLFIKQPGHNFNAELIKYLILDEVLIFDARFELGFWS